MKIDIISKEEFKKYKNDIDSIHLENTYPNGYLIDDVILKFINIVFKEK